MKNRNSVWIVGFYLWCMGYENTHKASKEKYKPYILKHKAHILK